jgi:hypothetical protein
MDSAPRCSFVVATRERCLWGEARSIALKGLPEDEAAVLLERAMERPLDSASRKAAASLCTVVGGHPLRLLQAAAIIRECGIPSDNWLLSVTPEHLLADLLSSIDDKQRLALLALAGLPGVPLHARHIAAIADVADLEPSLIALVRQGLVTTNQSHHQLAHGVADRLRRVEDLKPWVNRAITYWTSWAERHQRNMDAVVEESEVLLRVHQSAADNRRSEEVIALGSLVEGPLVLRARWGAWATVIERCLDTARATGNRSAEAWALHELGSRALCLGDAPKARVMLTQAMKLRDELEERSAAAVSQKNLNVLMPPSPEVSRTPDVPIESAESVPPPIAAVPVAPMPLVGAAPRFDLDSIPLRDSAEAELEPRTTSLASILLLAMMLAASGGFGYWAFYAGRALQPGDVDRIVSMIRRELDESMNRWKGTPAIRQSTASPALEPREATIVDLNSEFQAVTNDPPPAPLPNILIFSPRPSSFTRGGPTNLCYAVSDASQVRLEPDVGNVDPTRALRCVRVAPTRTTTYELTAYNRDGQHVRQQLVIFVR